MKYKKDLKSKLACWFRYDIVKGVRGRNSCRCFRVELVKLLPVHGYSVNFFFYILVFWEYWVLTKSRIPLKLVLGGVRVVALSISSHELSQ